jgi:REP-associated tyrosine transposase
LQQKPRPKSVNEPEWASRLSKLAFVRVEQWLDRRPANRILEKPELAAIIVDSMLHFASERYDLLAYVVMPSHIHWLFQPLPEWVRSLRDNQMSPRERVTYSMNRYSATQCNRLLHRKGQFWQSESYDHWVRDVEEMERIIRYIEDNPVKASLVGIAEAWQFSSAWMRKKMSIEWGAPIRKAHL